MPCDFNGSADYIIRSASVVSDRPLSMSIWFKADDLTTTAFPLCVSDEATDILFAIITLGGSAVFPYTRKVVIESSGSNGYTFVVSTAEYTANVWHHACIVIPSSGGGSVYLDAANKATALDSGTLSSLDNTTIGVLKRTGTAGFMNGSLSDAAIWDTALTDAEVSLIYNSRIKGMPLQIQPSNLVAYYPLDDYPDGAFTNGLAFKDRSGNGNDGVGVGTSGPQMVAETMLSYP